MKKNSLVLMLLMAFNFNYSQNIFTNGFDVADSVLFSSGWMQSNQSNPLGSSIWSVPDAANSSFAFGGNTGGITSYITCDINSTLGAGVISNWLFTPTVSIKNGDVISFYAKKGGLGTGSIYADNLELRISLSGDGATFPSSGETDLGDFTTLAVEINPTFNQTSFPFVWTQYSYTVTGLTSETACKFGFRYYVIDGGPDGSRSDIIGVDDFSVDRPVMNTNDFFKSNFVVYPNPVKDLISIKNKNGATILSAEIFDFNGRIVKKLVVEELESGQNNISDLNEGMYFLKITSQEGVGITKIMKK
jgi:hypothetical protein